MLRRGDTCAAIPVPPPWCTPDPELEAEKRIARGLLAPDFAAALMARSIVGHREEW